MSEVSGTKNGKRKIGVYSNVNKKKADKKSASKSDDIINLDNEIVIGLASFPEPTEMNEKNKKHKKNSTSNTFNKNTVNSKQTQKIKLSIREQKRRIIKKLTIACFLSVFIIASGVFFLLSPIFNVKKIEVSNNNFLSKEQIIIMSGINLNENTFKFSKNEVEKSILSNPYIERVDIDRKIFSNIVEISVKERERTLMLEYGNSNVYLNNQGYILEISTEKLNTPILKGYQTPLDEIKPGNRLNNADLERLEDLLKIIEAANSNGIGDLITEVDIKDKKNFIIILGSEDKTIHFGECTYLSTKMAYIKKMIQREKGIEGELFLNMDLNKNNPVFRERV